MTPARRKRAIADKARRVLDILATTHTDARIHLDFDGPFQLLIATILSAQCTDERVNMVTPALFERYPTPAEMAGAEPGELQEMIRSTGFFRQKTKSLLACCRSIVEDHGGKVPSDMESLRRIHGVGRKTANVVRGGAFALPGIAVDTHVGRVSTRIGLAAGRNADKIESQLCAVIPEERWSRATLLMGAHGRRICFARKPLCESCPVSDLCDYYAAAGRS